MTGHLALLRQEREEAQYYPISDASFLEVPVETGSRYLWQLLDSERKVVVGPYAFTFEKRDATTAGRILSSTGEAQTERKLGDPSAPRRQIEVRTSRKSNKK